MGACPPRRSWKLAFVSGFWGLRPRPPSVPCPWTPLGTSVPDPLFCLPVENSWLRPWSRSFTHISFFAFIHAYHYHQLTVLSKCAFQTPTRCVMAARWASQNSGPIFRRLWTKVRRIKFASAGVFVFCNAIFRLTLRSGDIRDQVAKLCEIAPKF